MDSVCAVQISPVVKGVRKTIGWDYIFVSKGGIGSLNKLAHPAASHLVITCQTTHGEWLDGKLVYTVRYE